jgi:sucrose phosphorylase
MRNGTHLIAFGDRFGARGITGLEEILDGSLRGAFIGVHVLHFYRPFDGADAGFDPTVHQGRHAQLPAGVGIPRPKVGKRVQDD